MENAQSQLKGIVFDADVLIDYSLANKRILYNDHMDCYPLNKCPECVR